MFRWAVQNSVAEIWQYTNSPTLYAKGTDLVKVVAIQMGIYSEESPEDRSHNITKVLWEWDT